MKSRQKERKLSHLLPKGKRGVCWKATPSRDTFRTYFPERGRQAHEKKRKKKPTSFSFLEKRRGGKFLSTSPEERETLC